MSTLPSSAFESALNQALESGEFNASAMLMTAIFYSGDLSVLERLSLPSVNGPESEGGVDVRTKEDIAAFAARALADAHVSGWRPELGTTGIIRMMRALGVAFADRDTVDLIKSDMLVGPSSLRRPSMETLAAAGDPSDFTAVVIGAGMAGICASIRLSQAGIDHVILEKNDDVGGTWLENTYPGCQVDVPSIWYSYSFAPLFSRRQFATQEENLGYLRRIADEFHVRNKILFHCEVAEATYLPDSQRWSVHVPAGTPLGHDISANFLVCATGQLNRPNMPDLPGRKSFTGIQFHSARWPNGLDLEDKRVALIGTGASATQIGPAIAHKTQELCVIQSSAPWIVPAPSYRKEWGTHHLWLLESVPAYRGWFRAWSFFQGDTLLPMMTVEADGNFDRAVSGLGEQVRQKIEAEMKSHLGDKPDLLQRATPRYKFGVNRRIWDDGSWYQMLRRNNVRLFNSRAAELTPSGVRLDSGQQVDVDVIIYATGFMGSEILWPIHVVGLDSRSLADMWASAGPKALLGTTIPGFPNLFVLFGPNTQAIHSGSNIFVVECQLNLVLDCIRLLRERNARQVDTRRDVFAAYNDEIDRANSFRAWGIGPYTGVGWYRHHSGRVVANWPYEYYKFWKRTRFADSDNYLFSP